MSKVKDYYKTLGISKSSSKDEIKKAYRDLARKYHPDLNPDNKNAEEKFKEIQEAYEVLYDDQKRQQYDAFGSTGFNSQPRGGPGFSSSYTYSGDIPSFDEIFKDIFSYAGGQGGPFRQQTRGRSDKLNDLFGNFGKSAGFSEQKPKNTQHEITVDFNTAIKGGTKDLAINSRDTSGKQKSEKLSVKIPPGVDTGSKIRIQGKGEQIGNKRGDLILKVKVQTHKIFRREKNNIVIDLPVTFYEAALGTKVDVPTIDGNARMVIPPGVQNGSKLRLKNKGVKNIKTGKNGDQYVIIKIVMPDKIDKNVLDKLEEIKNSNPYNPRKDFEQFT